MLISTRPFINGSLYYCSRNIFPDGSQLREKARQIAEQLGYHCSTSVDSGEVSEGGDTESRQFTASNG